MVLTETSVLCDDGVFMSHFYVSFCLLLLKECFEYTFAGFMGMNSACRQ